MARLPSHSGTTTGRLPHRLPPGLLPLTAAAACDVVFALGVLQGPGGPEQTWSPWLEVSALGLAITLPLLLLGAVVVALTGERHPSNRSGLHRLQVATVALAVLGLALYLSPWGLAGVRAAVET